jgi:hypothetical protein
MLCTAGHIPILGTLLRALTDNDIKIRVDNRHLNPYRIQGGNVCYPSYETYLQFSKLYDIDISAIFELEEYIECCVTLESCPYLFNDDIFKNGFSTEFPKTAESEEHNLIINDCMCEWDYIVNVVPMQEELEKLEGCTTLGQAISNAWKFGKEEDEDAGLSSHKYLHVLFTTLSWFNLDWGVGAHSRYNAYALAAMQDPCKRKRKKKKKKKNNNWKYEVKSLMKDAVKGVLIGGGSVIGGHLGGPVGAALGGKAGSAISKLVGSGEYHVERNTVMETGGVSFNSKRDHTVRIRHNEYLGDVIASSDFTNVSYPLNPGLFTTFPWLNQSATAFQQYKIHGIIFVYEPTSAAWSGNGQALGTVIMGTQYNVTRDPFSGKREMLNYEFSNSGAPDESLVHPVECAADESPLTELYVRTGPVPDDEDVRFYDFANFQLAVTGCDPTVDGDAIGELHVVYDIELFKPQLPPGGVVPGLSTRINNFSVTAADPFGPIQTTPIGNLNVSITSTCRI